tara:strand:- start:614 stop:799 length:186 start_codon:yes stop_codon:yes gene_type:complete
MEEYMDPNSKIQISLTHSELMDIVQALLNERLTVDPGALSDKTSLIDKLDQAIEDIEITEP